jgi:hypothetical protein
MAITTSCEDCLKDEGKNAGQAEFIAIPEDNLKDRRFCSDMRPLLRTDIIYDPQAAGKHVKTHLLNLLPA